MARIIGVEHLSTAELRRELQAGGRFVVYPFCVSVIVLTFRRSSDVFFLRAGESHMPTALGFLLLSLTLGWWGLPWGPIFTLHALFTTLAGGRDVTDEVARALLLR